MLALCAYALDKVEPNLTGTAVAIFTLIRPTLDAGWKKAIGGTRGTPQKDSEKKEERCCKDTAKEKEREKEKEGEIEIENECYTPKPPKGAKRFSPPSFDDVKSYCQERENSVDPQAFVDWYTSNGWKVGKNPMKDWKAAVRTWERKEVNHGRNGSADSAVESQKFRDIGTDL